jgi:hypothetical protein
MGPVCYLGRSLSGRRHAKRTHAIVRELTPAERPPRDGTSVGRAYLVLCPHDNEGQVLSDAPEQGKTALTDDACQRSEQLLALRHTDTLGYPTGEGE